MIFVRGNPPCLCFFAEVIETMPRLGHWQPNSTILSSGLKLACQRRLVTFEDLFSILWGSRASKSSFFWSPWIFSQLRSCQRAFEQRRQKPGGSILGLLGKLLNDLRLKGAGHQKKEAFLGGQKGAAHLGMSSNSGSCNTQTQANGVGWMLNDPETNLQSRSNLSWSLFCMTADYPPNSLLKTKPLLVTHKGHYTQQPHLDHRFHISWCRTLPPKTFRRVLQRKTWTSIRTTYFVSNSCGTMSDPFCFGALKWALLQSLVTATEEPSLIHLKRFTSFGAIGLTDRLSTHLDSSLWLVLLLRYAVHTKRKPQKKSCQSRTSSRVHPSLAPQSSQRHRAPDLLNQISAGLLFFFNVSVVASVFM